MCLDAFGNDMPHSVAELNAKPEHAGQIVEKVRCSNPTSEIAAADEFKEQERLSTNEVQGV